MPGSKTVGSVMETVITDEEYWRRVRKLAHDLRSPLSVICTGLQAMESVRTDEETFKVLHEMMESAGTELKELIETLAPSCDDTNRSRSE